MTVGKKSEWLLADRYELRGRDFQLFIDDSRTWWLIEAVPPSGFYARKPEKIKLTRDSFKPVLTAVEIALIDGFVLGRLSRAPCTTSWETIASLTPGERRYKESRGEDATLFLAENGLRPDRHGGYERLRWWHPEYWWA